jgi:hypothetical protein
VLVADDPTFRNIAQRQSSYYQDSRIEGAIVGVVGWGALFLCTEFIALLTTIGVLVSFSMAWGHYPSLFLAVTMLNALALIGAARFRSARRFMLAGMAIVLMAGMWQCDAPARECEARGGSYSWSYGCD